MADFPSLEDMKAELARRESGITIPGDPARNISVRQNNPYNLKGNVWGAKGTGTRGFAIYDSPDAGVEAGIRQLMLDQSRGMSFAKFAEKYAPKRENPTWKADVSMALGNVSDDTPLHKIPLLSLARAVAMRESSTKLPGDIEQRIEKIASTTPGRKPTLDEMKTELARREGGGSGQPTLADMKAELARREGGAAPAGVPATTQQVPPGTMVQGKPQGVRHEQDYITSLGGLSGQHGPPREVLEPSPDTTSETMANFANTPIPVEKFLPWLKEGVIDSLSRWGSLVEPTATAEGALGGMTATTQKEKYEAAQKGLTKEWLPEGPVEAVTDEEKIMKGAIHSIPALAELWGITQATGGIGGAATAFGAQAATSPDATLGSVAKSAALGKGLGIMHSLAGKLVDPVAQWTARIAGGAGLGGGAAAVEGGKAEDIGRQAALFAMFEVAGMPKMEKLKDMGLSNKEAGIIQDTLESGKVSKEAAGVADKILRQPPARQASEAAPKPGDKVIRGNKEGIVIEKDGQLWVDPSTPSGTKTEMVGGEMNVVPTEGQKEFHLPLTSEWKPESGPAKARTKEERIAARGYQESPVEYDVETEDHGIIRVNAWREKDGTVIMSHDKGLWESNPEFSKGKTIPEILAYHFEPLGFKDAKKAPTPPPIETKPEIQPEAKVAPGKGVEPAPEPQSEPVKAGSKADTEPVAPGTPRVYKDAQGWWRVEGTDVKTGSEKVARQAAVKITTPEPTPTGKAIKHFTYAENIPSIIDKGFDTSRDPIHGTGALEGGAKTGKAAKDVLYFTTDTDRWGTAEVFVGPGKGDISRHVYDYENQKWVEEKDAYKKVNLASLEANISPKAKVLTIDSYKKAQEFMGGRGLDKHEFIENLIDKAREEGYDVVNVQNTNDKLWERPDGYEDRYGEKSWYRQLTGASGKDDYFIINKDAISLQKPTPTTPTPTPKPGGEKMYGGGPETGPFVKAAIDNVKTKTKETVGALGKIRDAMGEVFVTRGWLQRHPQAQRTAALKIKMFGERAYQARLAEAALQDGKERFAPYDYDKNPLGYGELSAKIQSGKPIDPKLQFYVDTYRGMLDTLWGKAKDLGIRIPTQLDNYMRDSWKNHGDVDVQENVRNYFEGKPWVNHLKKDAQGKPKREEPVRWSGKRTLTGTRAYFKHKSLDPFTAVMLGYEPRIGNMVDMMQWDLAQKNHYVAGMEWLKAMKDEGLRGMFPIGKQSPGWEMIKDPTGEVARAFIKEETETRPFEKVSGEYDMTGAPKQKPQAVQLRMYAPPDVARLVNNFLGEGLKGNYLYQKYRAAGDPLRKYFVGFSPYHIKVTINTDMATGIGQQGVKAIGSLLSGEGAQALEHAKQLGKNVALWGTVENQVKGRQFMLEALKPGSHPEYAPYVQDYVAAGGRIPSAESLKPVYQVVGKALKDTAESIKGAKPFQAISNLADATSKPIMEYIVPQAKAAHFMVMRDLALPKFEKMADEKGLTGTERENAWLLRQQEIVRLGDNMFGQLAYDNLHFSNSVKDALFFVVQYPGWNIGSGSWMTANMGAAWQGAKKLAGKGTGPGEYERDSVKFTAGLLAKTVIFNATLAALLGTLPDRKNAHELITKGVFTGGYNPDGSKQYLGDADYMRDLLAVSIGSMEALKGNTAMLGSTLRAKSPFLISMAWELLSNTDHFNTRIWGPEGQGLAKYASKRALPYSLANLTQGTTPIGKYGWLLGYNIRPASLTRTPLETEVAKAKGFSKIKTGTEAVTVQERMDLERLAREGKGDEYEAKLGQMLESGKITPKQAKNTAKKLDDVRAYRFNGLPVDIAIKAYDKGSHSEKDFYARLLQRKINHFRKTNKAKYDQMEDQIEAIQDDMERHLD
ncbi:MAG: hypothetical protein ACYDHZ_00450 [Dehalococcoidia bacterium]